MSPVLVVISFGEEGVVSVAVSPSIKGKRGVASVFVSSSNEQEVGVAYMLVCPSKEVMTLGGVVVSGPITTRQYEGAVACVSVSLRDGGEGGGVCVCVSLTEGVKKAWPMCL